MALLIGAALTISTAGLVTVMASNEKSFGRDRQETLALNTAEAGLNYGISYLKVTGDPTGSATVGATAGGTSANPTTFPGASGPSGTGSGEWWATKTAASEWTVYARGTSPNTTVRRMVSVKVASATEVGEFVEESLAWTYGLFVANPGSTCFTPSGSATLTISIYVNGCINLSGNVGIAEPSSSSGGTVEVFAKTTLAFGSGSAQIGASTKKVLRVVAPGGCTGRKGLACTDPNAKVFALNYTGAFPAISKPTIDPDGTYASGDWDNPSCTVGSFVFDNNSVRDTSVSNADLFPSSSYSCSVYASSDTGHTGSPLGTLAWNTTTNMLTITGTIYIDGNLSMNSNTAAGYTTPSGTPPRAALYVNGTVSMNGTAALCGPPSTPSGGGCSGTWDGDYGALFLMAVNANGSNNPLAIGWNANGNAYYDLAAYVVGQYKNNGSSGVTGPVITDTADISGNGNSTDVLNPPASAPGASYYSPGSTNWNVIPASWSQQPVS
jgi:hypothetical protein